MAIEMRRAPQYVTLALIVFLVFVFLKFDTIVHVARVLYENGKYALVPSATLAYEYGTRHFDARSPEEYDLARAEYFFTQALLADPNIPFARHQLSRIAFLRGDFDNALSRINAEIEGSQSPSPSSYYVRGLIKGFMGDYDGGAEDYETYLKSDPSNWAALNDYAWVLLKANRPGDALTAVDWGLMYWPDNPWLLNSRATAHFELGQLAAASEAVQRASETVIAVTEEQWLTAYPGNDPLVALQGVEALKAAVLSNMHTISLALEKESTDMR